MSSDQYGTTDRVYTHKETYLKCSCGCNVFRENLNGLFARCNMCSKVHRVVEERLLMRDFRKMDPQVRHAEFAEIVKELKLLPEDTVDVVELVTNGDPRWGGRIDEAVVILLEQIRYVLQDVGLEGSALDWLDKLIDFKLSRESKLIFQRFEQTRRIAKAFSDLVEKKHPQKDKYKAELQRRGII